MLITNNYGLPGAIVRAVQNDPYDPGDCDISVTRLIGPPMIRHLTLAHQEEIVEDAADRIWSLLGQSVHSVIERAANEAAVGNREISEQRLYADVGGWRISGQLDLYETVSGMLTDFKVTSVWAVKLGGKDDWARQLNCLAWLLRRNGHTPCALQIVAILRDWRMNEAQRFDGYPASQVVAIPIDMWTDDEAQAYVEARVAAHRVKKPAPCTPEERWDKPATYAVMRPGRKSALRVLDTETEAWAWADAQEDAGKLTIETRPGESVRCMNYCSVKQWCDYGKEV